MSFKPNVIQFYEREINSNQHLEHQNNILKRQGNKSAFNRIIHHQ